MTPNQQAADLLRRGYIEVQEWGDFKVGQRVRHVSHQWATLNGSAEVRRIFHHPDSAWSRKYGAPDVELIVRKDGGDAGFWANYHTVPVRSES
jgi:hypothetical protein